MAKIRVTYVKSAIGYRQSQKDTIRSLGLDLIEVAPAEARRFALNLVSDGHAVTLTTGAPRLAAELRRRGLDVRELDTEQLRKGGGGIRCTSLTLDNSSPVRGPAAGALSAVGGIFV